MKYRIMNTITGEVVDPVELVQDLIERDKLFRLPLLFSGEFSDLQIVSSAEQSFAVDGACLHTKFFESGGVFTCADCYADITPRH